MWLKKSTGLQRQRRLHSAVQAHSFSILISSAPQIAEIFTLAPLATRIQVCSDPTLAGCHAFPVASIELVSMGFIFCL